MSSHGHLFVRYDGRGFGLSDRDVSDFSLPARVSDLEAVVDELGLERFGLYAVSAGGPVAIAFTAKHPERVTRLVLAGTVASWSWLSDAQIGKCTATCHRAQVVTGEFCECVIRRNLDMEDEEVTVVKDTRRSERAQPRRP